MSGSVASRVPLIDYLVLDDPPHLEANECLQCGARFLDRRNACASCFRTGFRRVPLPSEGKVAAYTIVHVGAVGLPLPYVAAVVDCGGTWVKVNLVKVEPDPAHIELGMDVRLTTFTHGTDSNGTEAVGFGFEPVRGG